MTDDKSMYYTIYGDIWYKSGYSCFLKCEFVNSPKSERSPFGVIYQIEGQVSNLNGDIIKLLYVT